MCLCHTKKWVCPGHARRKWLKCLWGNITLSITVSISSPAHFQPHLSSSLRASSLPDHHIWLPLLQATLKRWEILNFFPWLRIRNGNKLLSSYFRGKHGQELQEIYLPETEERQEGSHLKICTCHSSQAPQAQSPPLSDQPSTSSALFCPDGKGDQLSRNSKLLYSTIKVFD